MTKRLAHTLVIVSLIVLAWLYIRTLKLDLPYRFHVDEDYFYTSALRIRITGLQYNPLYPPLSPYLTSMISLVMDAASGGAQYAGDALTSSPTYYAGRLSSALLMLVGCCFFYQIGARLHSPAAGLAALWLFGTDAQVFAFAYQMRGDAAAYAFAAASIFYALLGLQQPGARRWRWLSSLMMLLAILGKYSIAPLAVFPAYLWLRRFVPAVRHQLILVGGGVLLGAAAVLAIRTWGRSWIISFEKAGFLFLFAENLITPEYLGGALNQVQAVMGAALFYSAVVVTVGAVLILWRSLTGVQRRAYALLLIAALGLIPVAAATELRYRDVFVLPYALFITWAVSSALLANRFVGRAGPALVVVAALIFTTPRFAANVRESEFLRLGDSRVAASRWLEANVRTPSRLAKEYTIGDFLTHANGYQGGQLSWSSVGSILEQTPQQWWEQGVMYLVADSRTTTNSWFDAATPRSRFDGLTLAYQTPSDYPGPGSHIAIFYTFAIRTPTNVRFGDVAQLYGYNLDQRQACPGAQVGMRMFLRALGATDLYYEMEIVLRDAAGAAVITQRQAPALGQRPTTVWEARELIFDDHWLELPPDLAPGVYTLELAVYEPFHQERVRVYTPDLVLVGESVALGQLAVTRAAC